MSEQDQAVVTEQVTPVDTSAGTATPAAPEGTAPSAPQPKPETKTFTQQELDAIVEKRVARAKRSQDRDLDSVVEAKVAAKLAAIQPPKPTADEAPKRENFESYEDYIRADARYVAKEELKAGREAQTNAEQEKHKQEREKTITDRYSSAVEKAATQYEDFEDNFTSLLRMSIPTEVAVQMREAIAESDQAPELLHYLATNPQDAQRIAKLSPTRAAAEIGKLETKLQPAPVPAKPASVSRAPAPIEPLAGGVSAVSDKAPDDPDEYKRWHDERERAKRKRA